MTTLQLQLNNFRKPDNSSVKKLEEGKALFSIQNLNTTLP